MSDGEPRPRATEPWPWIVGGLLGTMICVSLAFLWTAVAHPDPPVVDDAYRAGLEYAEGFESPVPLGLADDAAPGLADDAAPDAPDPAP